jgi:hypothetical protein
MACGSSASSTPSAPTSPAATTTSASPEVTTPPSTSPSPVDDTIAVEDAVRAYLAAVEADDYPGKVDHSVGDLVEEADWDDQVSLSFGDQSGTLDIQELRVTSVEGDTAHVDLHAEFRVAGFEGDPPTVLTGPMTVVRAPDGWKVKSYVQDGRDREASIFTKVHGEQEVSGLHVAVDGVDVRAGAILLVFTAENSTDVPLTLQPTGTIVGGGTRIEFGEPSGTHRTAVPGQPLESYIYWSSGTLGEDVRSFDLRLEFQDDSGGHVTEFDIPVDLVS